jgi:uncharacterized membrane protein YeiB
MIWLIHLYPARWRKRYGGDLEQLVHDLRPSTSRLALALDLIKGAVDAHVQQRFDMQTADLRAIKRAALIAAITWLGLSVEIILSNVVFPSKNDEDAISVLISYLCIFAALLATGMLAARDGAGRKGLVLAGLIAGTTIGALTVATFTLVDNVWLDIVAQQQAKIDGFAHSGAASMREYINDGLIGAAVFLTVALGVFGAVLSLVGGLVGREPPSPSSTTAVKRTKS